MEMLSTFYVNSYRYIVTCPTVAVGRSSRVSLMLIAKTGCNTAGTGGMTAHLLTAALPALQVTTT